jgi:hypothetical protein
MSSTVDQRKASPAEESVDPVGSNEISTAPGSGIAGTMQVATWDDLTIMSRGAFAPMRHINPKVMFTP